jgi:hypothetical protein
MNFASEAHAELYVYALERENFIVQHVVDATGVQTATADAKPIGVIFSLAGLYLHVELGYTGRQVQQIHRQLAERRRTAWPSIELPNDRGIITAADVMAAAPGPDRDNAIDEWCRSVWTACVSHRATVLQLLSEHRIM